MSHSNDDKIDLWGVARFYLPLSVTSFLIMMSHNIVNAGIARGSNPEVGLAAFRMAKSLVLMVENPVFMVRQSTVSLVTGTKSFRLVSRTFMTIAFLIALLLAFFAVSGSGNYVFTNLFGAAPETAKNARLAMGVLFVLPIVSCSRNLYQGAAVLTHQTRLVPFATAVRVVFALMLMMVLTHFPGIPGALMGGILFVGGITIESLVTYFSARGSVRQISQFRQIPGDQGDLTFTAVILFFVPLVFTSLMQQITMPVINTRIGFGALSFPEVPIAAFAAGFDLGSLLLSPVSMLHQASMMFGDHDDPEVRRAVKQFCIAWVGMVALAMCAISFSPVGRFILTDMIGVSEQLCVRALSVLKILSLVVLIRGWREYLWGICMKRRSTSVIGSSKTVALVAIVVLVFVGIRTLDWYPSAVVTAALGVGEVIETVLVSLALKRTDAAVMQVRGLSQA